MYLQIPIQVLDNQKRRVKKKFTRKKLTIVKKFFSGLQKLQEKPENSQFFKI
jgi:hypothetical protein